MVRDLSAFIDKRASMNTPLLVLTQATRKGGVIRVSLLMFIRGVCFGDSDIGWKRGASAAPY